MQHNTITDQKLEIKNNKKIYLHAPTPNNSPSDIPDQYNNFVVSVLPATVSILGKQNYFESKTQYDQCFNSIYKDYPKTKKGFACPLFALITTIEFFKNKNITNSKHDENLQKAITMSAMLSIDNQTTFENLIKYTNLAPTLIMHATTNVISLGYISLDMIIPDNNKDFCVIFFKNSRFFVVIGDSTTKTYCVRDCHEIFQYNFQDKSSLFEYLNITYSMNKSLIVDGVMFSDYSLIEYVVIQSPFTDTLDQKLEQVIFGNGFKELKNQDVKQDVKQDIKQNINQNLNKNKEQIIIKKVASTNPLVVGYIENLPDDGVDMIDLQRRFGGDYMGDINELKFNGYVNNDRLFDSDEDNKDNDDNDNELDFDDNNDKFGQLQVHDKIYDNDNHILNDDNDDEFFKDD
jgi:hypothetical protein